MATKIQVRRDTTANWTNNGDIAPAAGGPAAGEFCYDTQLKTLKIGDGVSTYNELNVIADSDFDPTGVDDRYVFTDGDNMTGDLTLGTDKITLDATDGTADFAGTITSGGFDDLQNNKRGARLNKDGSLLVQRRSTDPDNDYLFRGFKGTSENISFTADGSAVFAGRIEPKGITSTSGFNVLRNSGSYALSLTREQAAISASEVFKINASDKEDVIVMNTDGSSTFSSSIGYGLAGYINEGDLGTILGDSATFQYGVVLGVKPDTNMQVRDVVIALNPDGGKAREVARFKGADGSATFAGEVDVSALNYGGTADGLPNDKGRLSASGSLIVDRTAGATNVVVGRLNGEVTSLIRGDGAATFAKDNFNVSSNGYTNVQRLYDGDENKTVLELQTSNGPSYLRGTVGRDDNTRFEIFQNGSASFAGSVRAGHTSVTDPGVVIGETGDLYSYVQQTNATVPFAVWRSDIGGTREDKITFRIDGSSSFAGDIDANNVSFNLEPDNDDNYTVTTEEYEEQEELTPYVPAVEPVVGPLGNVLVEGTPAVEATYQTVTKTREIRTYSGPTLDVKAVIQELQQRVADRDAVIASLTTRLTALEADHATLMGNSNGGY